MTVHQLLKSLPSSEITEWIAEYKIRNEEQERANIRAKAESQASRMRRVR